MPSNIVKMDIPYPYAQMMSDIDKLKKEYPFLETGKYGKSVLGRDLVYLRLGEGKENFSYNASHHGLEWLNTVVLMKFAEEYLDAYKNKNPFHGYDVHKMWKDYSIYLIPMVNPDGVDVVINGISPLNPFYKSVTAQNKTGKPVQEVWNANIRGVDLNRNYPAKWELAKKQEKALGINGPGPTRFGGYWPLSEPETMSLVEFTNKMKFKAVIAFHTQGEIIYWRYGETTPPIYMQIAEQFSKVNGYEVANNPAAAAYAGYKDWFIKIFGLPGFTFETGIGKNPLPISQIPNIYKQNVKVLLMAPSTVDKYLIK